MKKKILKALLAATVFGIACTSFYDVKNLPDKLTESGVVIHDSIPSMKMYNSILKYSEEYNIPKEIAFGVAYQETRYKGPIDTSYKGSFRSKAGALGPMQIMYSTAKLYIQKDEQLTKKLLKTDIDLNVRLSMRILRDLKDTYGTWGKALGAYNTGKPVVNKYAKNILKKSYNWIGFSKTGTYLL
jgi:soluble lytic murein transglycosylase-like protein